MPAKRRTTKHPQHRITDDAIAAYVAGDFVGLHSALSWHRGNGRRFLTIFTRSASMTARRPLMMRPAYGATLGLSPKTCSASSWPP